MDVTFGKPFAFCPIEDDDTVVTGLNMISEKCPGNLVGVMHHDGQEAAEKWCAENPTWHADFSSPNAVVRHAEDNAPQA